MYGYGSGGMQNDDCADRAQKANRQAVDGHPGGDPVADVRLDARDPRRGGGGGESDLFGLSLYPMYAKLRTVAENPDNRLFRAYGSFMEETYGN